MGIVLEMKVAGPAQEKATIMQGFNFHRNLVMEKSQSVTRLQRKASEIVIHKNEASKVSCLRHMTQ